MHIADTNKISQLSLLILISVFLMDCNSKKRDLDWSIVTIDVNISKQPIYLQLDKEKEIFSAFEKNDSSIKRTSDVEYVIGREIYPGEPSYQNSKYNNCRAYFLHLDTLLISIGIGSGFGAQGFTIKYKDSKFYTEPYYLTDVIRVGEVKPTYKLIYQRLILNKPIYKLGDSLYGRIEFRSIETDKNKKKIEHTGKGYFRTKVTQL